MAILAQLIDGVVAHKFEIDAKLRLGRLAHNDIVIDDSSVSSNHAVIERIQNPDFPEAVEFFIEDLNSTNGTEVNGDKISRKMQLHHEDVIKVAWNTFKFIDEHSVNLTKTVHILK